MKGLFRILLGAVAALVLVAVVLAIVVLMVFDPDDYQQMITDTVYEQTGRTLVIDGGISLDTLPCCSVELERGRLSNPADFPEGDFAIIESVRLGLRLWPLLTRQEIEIGNIGLDGLELNLLRDESGSANWEFEMGAPQEPVEPEPDETATVLPPLTAGGLKISDARIIFQDRVSGADYRVDDFDLQTGKVIIGEPVEIEMALQATDVASEMSLRADVSMTVDMNFDTQQAAFRNVNADIAVDIAGDMSVRGDVSMSVDLDLETQLATVRDVKADIAVDGAALPDGGAKISAQTETVAIDIESGGIEILNQRAVVNAAGATVGVTANGLVADGVPELTGTLKLEPLSPRELLRTLEQPDMKTSDPNALSSLEADMQWSLGKELVAARKMTVRLDDTTVKGSIQVNYLDLSALRFDFIGDQLAIDRYLEPESEQAPAGAQSAAPQADSSAPAAPTEVPVETVRGLNFGGRVRLGRLTMDALLLENLDTTIGASGGLVRLDPMTADLYGGQYNGAVTIDVTGEKPTVGFRQSVASVQAKGLLTDLADTENLEGVLEANFTGKGVGRTDQEIINTLAGDISFDLTDGIYKGVDVWYEIRNARAMLKREPGPAESADPQTPIETMTFTGRIDDGVMQTQKMLAEIPFLSMTGNGSVNMIEENLNFAFRARVDEKPVFEDGEDLGGLQGFMIPLTVTGAVDSPSVGVDLSELAKSEATKKVEEKLFEKLGLSDEGEPDPESGEPPPEDTKDKVKKSLRGLFGR